MSEKILLVDDEEGIRKVLGISLEDMGYKVFTAENAKDALDIFMKEEPEIVVTDIKMPGMDGIDLLRNLKHINSDTEVVVITGHGDMDLAIKSLKYEATDFITKPIEDEDLERALQKCRERIKLRDQLRSYTENLESLLRQKTEKLAQISTDGKKDPSRQYERLFEELPGYVCVINPDFEIVAANRQIKEDFDFDSYEKKLCYNIVKQAHKPCVNCPVKKTFEDGKSHREELSFSDKNKNERKVIAWTSPFYEKPGLVSRVMIMATDISGVIDLKDHLASLGLMIGSVSHGIKGLLTGLDSGVYLLNSGFAKDDPQRVSEGLKIVKTISSRIKNMVLDILYYAKERELDIKEIDIMEFMKELASLAKTKAQGKSIDFTENYDPLLKDIKLMGDETQLRAALFNILENAIDACVEDFSEKSHGIFINAKKEENDLVIEIIDNGTGMEKETCDKIFTLFFSSKSTKGTGIGLFVSKKIINQHKGDIKVDSQPGKGTIFTIRLPFSGPDALS